MKKILYIEDDRDTAEGVRILLNNAGFETEVAVSGKECLKKSEEKNYDLFLLDIMLPDMAGWDILENLKKKGVKSKFAFLSAIPVSVDRLQELKKAAIEDYILKPFTKDDLIKRVKNILTAKILYVEDNEDTANAVKMILAKEGFSIEIAASGKECMEKAKKYFDLILLDMMLPDMSGWDIFEKLKNNQTNSKFAFLTSVDADSKRINELKEVGITDYIKKPFSKEELIKRITRVIKN